MKHQVSLFLDSGAFSLYSKYYNQTITTGQKNKNFGKYYMDKTFIDYRDQYILFIKENKKFIDHYANLDIIGDASKTYEMQKYLEKQGLSPLPVYHFGEDIKWLNKYIAEGYDYICLGGVVSLAT